MRTKILFIAAALLFAFSMPSNAASRKSSGAKATTTVKQTKKTLQKDGTTVSFVHYDAPAYYKVAKNLAGFSSGYSDNSFVIDWPTASSKGDVTALQQWILSSFGGNRKFKTIGEFIKYRNKCEFTARRVPKIPESAVESCLSDQEKITAQLVTADILLFVVDYYAYSSGGVGASFVYGTGYNYYDLTKQRELKTADLFLPQTVDVIVDKLKSDDEMDDIWEEVWEEFKSAPYIPDNFELTADKVAFIYSKYEIAPGAAGNIKVEVPLEQAMPYATPLLKTIVKAMEK